MLDDLVPIVLISSFVGGSFLFLIWHYEGIVPSKRRTAFANYLLSRNPDSGQVGLLSFFLAAFDGYFGPNPRSRTFLCRSIAISSTAFTGMMIVFFIWNDVDFKYISTHTWKIVLLGAVLNPIPDYLSLVQSRAMFHFMDGRTPFVIGVLLALDLVATSVIISVSYFILILAHSKSIFHTATVLPTILLSGLMLKKPEGIAIYTTYLTSMWLWLYMMSSLLLRVRRLFVFLEQHEIIDVKGHPMRTAGLVAYLPTTVLTAAVIWIVSLILS